MKLQVTTKKRGKGFWKLNNSLLKDEIYKQGIKNIIKKVKLSAAILTISSSGKCVK